MDIESALNQLAMTLRNSPEYKKMVSDRSVVDSNGKLKALVDELEKKQSRLYSGRLSENEANSLYAEISDDINKLSQIKEAKNYFESHERFETLLHQAVSGLVERLKN